ncbi:MAG: DUF1116 domain-containing protein [Chloroflexia bacterium]|nr:DUF1116 domain-containing protein [Chloroflexia bacterium]
MAEAAWLQERSGRFPCSAEPPPVINVGLQAFAQALRQQGGKVVQVDWQPPRVEGERSAGAIAANEWAWPQIEAGQPQLLGARRAGDLLASWEPLTLIHPGPALSDPVPPESLRTLAADALCREGWAGDAAQAAHMLSRGEVAWQPSALYSVALPADTLLSPSMLVWWVEDGAGRTSLGPIWSRPARDGAEQVARRRLAAAMDEVLGSCGGLDLAELAARGLEQGECGHGCSWGSTGLALAQLLPLLGKLPQDWPALLGAGGTLYLSLLLPMARLLADRMVGPEHSLVTAMGGNGRAFGLRVGASWRVLDPAPSGLANLGDEALLETVGLGGLALGAAPTLAQRWGLPPLQALRSTIEMYEISEGESERWRIPLLAPSGVALGLNSCRVREQGILPLLLCRKQREVLAVPEELFRD